MTEQIKRSVVKVLKEKYGMEDDTDEDFVEWWRRNHGTGYQIKIVEDNNGGPKVS